MSKKMTISELKNYIISEAKKLYEIEILREGELAGVLKINSDLPKTESDWIEEKRKKFAEIANKNNPYAGLIFKELYLNNKAYKIIRLSDGKVLYKDYRYPAVYNRAMGYNVKVAIEK